MMDSDPRNIVINHVHPGLVDTDMTNYFEPQQVRSRQVKTLVENKFCVNIIRGTKSAVYACLLPSQTSIRGAFLWHDCQEVDWVNGPLPSAV